MKTIKYTFILILTMLLCSCEDYLEKVQDFEGLDQENVFTDVRLAKDFLDGAYTHLIYEVSSVDQGTDWLPAMTMAGEGHPGRLANEVPETYNLYAQGDYLSLMNKNAYNGTTPNFVTRYYAAWKGIRVVNSFLENATKIANATPEEINLLKGQAYFLRASFYELMTKRHGGLVYLKKNLELNEPLDKERESYQSNLTNMLEDIDLSIELLPISWPTENVGRPTKGAAMALKSRLTLFAASPLINTSNSSQAWEDAAKAATELISFANSNGLYSLVDASAANSIDVGHNGTDLFTAEPAALKPYRNIFVGPGITKVIPSEVIFMEVNQKFFGYGGILNPTPRLALTTGFDIMKGNNSPMNIGALANFVEKFETKNGLAIKDDPTYNSQEPFINRDPRFYNAILFDGVSWIHTSSGAINSTGFVDLAVVNEQGIYGKDLNNPATPANLLWRVQNSTGYRIRKWIPNGAYWISGSNGSWDFHVNNNLFRMSEVYLNYAEAANEAYGPTGSAPGSSLTAIEAINIIRNRVGMPNIDSRYTSSKDIFRERIRNERAIELCFEGFRYDDLRRWKVAHLEENQKVDFLEMRWQGAPSATYPTGFNYQVVEQSNLKKNFTDRNYWWPVPSSEIEAVPSFGQTPGW
ncbi:RagB/SusD family nutrient uptake outer membrane protein [Flavobacterium algicola]|uniref:RagB/SusD family nutrient uptake outer membrane protein n=1 Tax=Flavobacterium algicola TaxID=556529 RepID=UPI001EFD0FC0|nr:RagB/SusD family nutrient uptake outer membrane protein [Flavobacterium algicola]MCG9792287.1 RagB/SusD family nutrient uptake outer membrane protein [Flavobacterium algicola]